GGVWWIGVAYLAGVYAWCGGQVHQTKYLIEIGFTPSVAAWALGLVSLFGIPGQILLGHLSDRIGREWVWTVSCLGFASCFVALIRLESHPTLPLLYAMMISQGGLGHRLTSVLRALRP